MTHDIAAIAAIGKNRELGKDNKLIWKIPEDLKRFKSLTTGHPIIMGRKTFDSIVAYGGRALPNRTNIVITRDNEWGFAGAQVAHSIEEALKLAKNAEGGEKIFIIGGTQVFEAAFAHLTTLHLTIVDSADPDADAFFPPFDGQFPTVTLDELHEWEGLRFRWVDLHR